MSDLVPGVGWAVFEPVFEDGLLVDFRWVDVSDFLCEINGIPRSDQIGERVSEILPDLWRTAVRALFRDVWETGESYVGIVEGKIAGVMEKAWRVEYARVGAGEVSDLFEDLDDEEPLAIRALVYHRDYDPPDYVLDRARSATQVAFASLYFQRASRRTA